LFVIVLTTLPYSTRTPSPLLSRIVLPAGIGNVVALMSTGRSPSMMLFEAPPVRRIPACQMPLRLFSCEDRQVRPNSAAVYVRHRPETTLLYQIIREYWPEFQAELASQAGEGQKDPGT
jgi:hypothetical protein